MRRPSMFYPSASSAGSEIDLRLEFDILLYGDAKNISHGRPILLRNMRRDADGYPTKCVCFSVSNTVEADPDCSYCLGEGYLWNEKWILTYTMFLDAGGSAARKYVHMVPGLERTDYKVFFLRYNTTVKYEDKLVEVLLDVEGNPVIPYKRTAIYKPHTIKDLRSDHGRIEYLALFCREEDAWKTDNP